MERKQAVERKRLYGARFKQARQLRGVTRVALAELIQQPWWIIVDIENDARTPEGQMLFDICRALDFPKGFFEQEPRPGLPIGSLAFKGEWTEDEIELF